MFQQKKSLMFFNKKKFKKLCKHLTKKFNNTFRSSKK